MSVKVKYGMIIIQASIAGVVTSIIFFAVLNMSLQFGKEVELGKLQQNYMFLIFPKNDVEIYESELLEKPVSVIHKAVTISQKELNEGVVGVVVNDKQYYANSKDFMFLPQNEITEKRLIEAWNSSLLFQGYTSGSWNSEKANDKNFIVSFSITDDDHARSDNFKYLTNGVDILKVWEKRTLSGVVYGIYFIISFFVSFLFFILVLSKRKAMMKSP